MFYISPRLNRGNCKLTTFTNKVQDFLIIYQVMDQIGFEEGQTGAVGVGVLEGGGKVEYVTKLA